MARGPKKHLKRLNAPSHWMLDKLGGVYAVRPRAGPHRLLESIPLSLIIRNRLKYALSNKEVNYVTKQRFIKVDGRIRTDPKFPAGFMDVISIEKTGDRYRLLYNTKGKFILHKIKGNEVGIKVCRIKRRGYAPNRTPYVSTHDGRTLRFPDPNIGVGDSVLVDVKTNKVLEWAKLKPGALVAVTGGSNTGRIGVLVDVERHPGSFDIVHIKDSDGSQFATRSQNAFVIGTGADKAMVALPKGNGVRESTIIDRERKLARLSGSAAGGSKKRKAKKSNK